MVRTSGMSLALCVHVCRCLALGSMAVYALGRKRGRRPGARPSLSILGSTYHPLPLSCGLPTLASLPGRNPRILRSMGPPHKLGMMVCCQHHCHLFDPCDLRSRLVPRTWTMQVSDALGPGTFHWRQGWGWYQKGCLNSFHLASEIWGHISWQVLIGYPLLTLSVKAFSRAAQFEICSWGVRIKSKNSIGKRVESEHEPRTAADFAGLPQGVWREKATFMVQERIQEGLRQA